MIPEKCIVCNKSLIFDVINKNNYYLFCETVSQKFHFCCDIQDDDIWSWEIWFNDTGYLASSPGQTAYLENGIYIFNLNYFTPFVSSDLNYWKNFVNKIIKLQPFL